MSRPASPRLRSDERRRQLIGIGLRMLVERPIHELSLDAVAAEAGISRGLLFHYFPTKAAFHEAVLSAAVRRILRNTAPDEGARGEAAVRQVVDRLYRQVDRRRAAYLALLFGNGALSLGGDRVESLRTAVAARVLGLLDLDDAAQPVVHAWCAYLEDRALQWSGAARSRRRGLDDEVDHAVAALQALLALERTCEGVRR